MIYKRFINLSSIISKKSILLLGPRQTGKSTLVTSSFPEATYINLASSEEFRELSSRPELIRQRISSTSNLLIIDEAQRVPELFDEIQLMLDRNKNFRVILTGSSARKLRRTGINLIPGRIWRKNLFPLIYPELSMARIEDRAIRGSLPGIIDNPDFRKELKNYADLYLDEEIRAEGLVRAIGDFGRFLTVAALCSGEQLNFTNVSNDTGVKINTVRAYFQILEDTLIGYQLPAFGKTKTRKSAATPKFYFFDCGIVNALLNRFEVSPQSELYGKALEHIVFLEIKAYLSYLDLDYPFEFWRSLSKMEVDFIVGGEIAIEVKSRERITPHDEKGIMALEEDVKLRRKIIVCRERHMRVSDRGVEIMPIDDFFQQLWNGNIIK